MTDSSSPASHPGPSRRTLTKAAAWTVPAVAMSQAAPAVAASPIPCTPSNGVINTKPNCAFCGSRWTSSISTDLRSANASGYARPSDTSSTSLFSFSVKTTTYGDARLETNDSTDAVRHLTDGYQRGTYSGLVNPIPITNRTTGCRGKGSAANYAHRQTTCFTFGQPIYNLRVRIGDIDSMYGTAGSICTTRYRDNVALKATYRTGETIEGGTREANSNVIGTGTVADPFRRPDSYLPTQHDPWSSTAGTVATNFSDGPITQLCVDFWSGEGGGLQVVLLHLSFQYCA